MKTSKLVYAIFSSLYAGGMFGLWKQSLCAGLFMFTLLMPILTTALSIEDKFNEP